MKHRSVLIYGKGEGMYTIAIVEDDKTQAASLKEYLLRYAAENGEAFAVKTFSNAVIFLENYTAVYDVVFMDIKMPYLNGIAAAHKLRELDKGVLLFFITSLTQYAIRGYEVDALNYIVKPVEYNEFALKFKKAVDRLAEKKSGELLVPRTWGIRKYLPRKFITSRCADIIANIIRRKENINNIKPSDPSKKNFCPTGLRGATTVTSSTCGTSAR